MARARARRHALAARGRARDLRSSASAGSASCSRSGRRCAAFDIHAPLPAAGLVLVLMNVATIFPLWPGNVGLVQAAIALPLVAVRRPATRRASRSGFGLQAIEASVGIGVGLSSSRARGSRSRCCASCRRTPTTRPRGRSECARRRRRVRAARSRARLASRASCPPARRPRRSPRGFRARGADADELPVADGGEGTVDVLDGARRRAARRRATRSAGRVARTGSCSRTARRWSRRRRRSRSIRTRLDPLRGVEPRARPADRRAQGLLAARSSGSAARRRSTAAPGCSRCSTSCRCRRASPATWQTPLVRRAARSSARRRARRPAQVAELEARFAGRGSRRSPSCRARARPAGSARRSPRSARSSSPARSSCST